MRVRAKVANMAAVEMTLQVTMTIPEWQDVRRRLDHPMAKASDTQLLRAIDRAIARIDAVVDEEVEVTTYPEKK